MAFVSQVPWPLPPFFLPLPGSLGRAFGPNPRQVKKKAGRVGSVCLFFCFLVFCLFVLVFGFLATAISQTIMFKCENEEKRINMKSGRPSVPSLSQLFLFSHNFHSLVTLLSSQMEDPRTLRVLKIPEGIFCSLVGWAGEEGFVWKSVLPPFLPNCLLTF